MAKNKKDIICELRCWQGRKILLHKSTLLGHVIRLHLDSAFIVDALKRNFNKPICVKKNVHHGTLNAFYDIQTGGQPFLMVAVKVVNKMARIAGKDHFIKTFYGVDSVPLGPYEWGETTMNPRFEIDKTTNVAYFDSEDAAEDAVIRMHSVSHVLGLKCQVLVRVDIKNKQVLGLVIEDFKAFKREMRMKYLAWRVEKLIELLLCRVRNAMPTDMTDDSHLLAPAR